MLQLTLFQERIAHGQALLALAIRNFSRATRGSNFISEQIAFRRFLDETDIT